MSNKRLQIDLDVRGARKSKKEIQGVDSAVSRLGKSALVTAGAFFGGRALLDGFRSAINLAGEQQRVEAQLNQVIKSTGGVAGVTAKQVKEMASAFQQTTRFGDETIINASNLMLTFTKIGKDVFPQAIESVLNMSQAMGQDLQQTVIQVGKALNDPILGVTALRRVGIQLTDEQTNMIKSFMDVNDVASAQQIILGELETQFGGLAKSGQDTSEFALAQMGNAFGDLAENIGTALTPALKVVTQGMKSLSESMGEVITGSPVDNLREQQVELNALANALSKNLDNEEMREDLIGRINNLYPSFLKGMKAEELGVKDITEALVEHNQKFQERINLAVAETLVKEKIEASTEAFENQVQANLDLADKIQLVSERTGVAVDVNQSFEEQIKTQKKALEDMTGQATVSSTAMDIMSSSFMSAGFGAMDAQLLIDNMNTALENTKTAEDEVGKAVDEVTEFRNELNDVMNSSLTIQDEIIRGNSDEEESTYNLARAYAELQNNKNVKKVMDDIDMDEMIIDFDEEQLADEMAMLQEDLNKFDLELPPPPPIDFGTSVTNFLEEQAPALEAGYNEFVNSLVDIEMTGKERREQMFIATRNMFIRTTGEMLKAHIKSKMLEDKVSESSATKQLAIKTFTSAKTLAIEKASALKSMIVTNTSAIAGVVANMAKATASAIAGLGPTALIGAPLVIAGMAALTNALKSQVMNRKAFAQGGMVEGVGNTDKVPAVLTAGELVLNSAQQDRLADNLQGQGSVFNIHIEAPLVDETIVETIIPKINDAVVEGRAILRSTISQFDRF
mgnify:FL=1